jgi:amino acid adenylation domain-containing protein
MADLTFNSTSKDKEDINPEEVFVFPLSFSQERLWILDNLSPNQAIYVASEAIQLNGILDIQALEKSLRWITDRHEILRTTFPIVDGSPVQAIKLNVSINLPVIDLSTVSVVDRYEQVEKILLEESQRNFDLEKEILWRCLLVRTAEDCHMLVITTHHIICDGWSMGIFLRELSSIYQDFTKKIVPSLPELSIQYADFSEWQREWLSGEVLAQQLAYWQGQLADAPPLVDLPTDFPRPSVQSFIGENQSLVISEDALQALRTLSNQQGVTLFVTLLAILKVLLFKWTGQQDLVVGTVIANRNKPEIEPLIGCFMNYLALRSYLDNEKSFADLLQQLKDTVLDAYTYQDCPFEKIVEVTNPSRQSGHNPIYNIGLQLQNFPLDWYFSDDVVAVPIPVDISVAHLDLRWTAQEFKGKMIIDCEYDTAIFAHETVTRMLQHFQQLTEKIVLEIDKPLKSINMLPEEELDLLLHTWNQTTREYLLNFSLHQLIEIQVDKTPEEIAVIYENNYLSYAELNHQANQLAHYLQNLGVKPETLVGICLERSLDMIIGLLAILKAGGAYIPIDPDYPDSRIAFMIQDSEVSLLLTQRKFVEKLPEFSGVIICLDQDSSEWTNQDRENPRNPVNSDNLAYVIYTSGSTGQPKGAMNTHKGIVNRLLWMQETYQLTSEDRVLQKTPFSFDVSVWEFFWPLLTGAKLIFAQPGGHRDSNYLANLITQEGITTLHFVPSMLQVFLEEPNVTLCQSLRQVFCSGEALPISLQKRFFERLSCQLHNLYGPTEAAVDVTYWACQADDDSTSVPIGCPIANTQLYILDSALQPVPLGAKGELYIGGVGVARGYLNRPKLTAEKFLRNPFSANPQGRLYKTGDLARYRADGNIEYLGRLDFQVKLRGFRIELGEIETALTEHPQVREALVMPKSDHQTTIALIAYLVLQGPGSQETQAQNTDLIAQLRTFLANKLPEYMVPNTFVVLESMPLNANGKVDRRSLPEPDTAMNLEETAYIAPRNSLEETLSAIWQEVLGLEKISINQNFFHLGGHSLLATQVINRIREKFSVTLPLRSLFEKSTIAELGEYLHSILQESQQREEIEL